MSALAVALGGCVTLPAVRSETATQLDTIGALRLQTTLCPWVPSATGGAGPLATRPSSEPAGACARRFQDIVKGTSADLPGQVLLAFRLPAGASAPDHLTATGDVRMSQLVNGSGSNPVTSTRFELTRSPSLESSLAAWYAAPEQAGSGAGALPTGLGAPLADAHQQLVGYVSDALPGPLVSDLRLTTDIRLPAGSVEHPYSGPLNHLTLVGWRLAATQPLDGTTVQPATLSPSRPVVCDGGTAPESVLAALLADDGTAGDMTVCPLPAGPAAATAGTTVAARLAGTDSPVRDLHVIGAAAAAEQGTIVAVPFVLRGTGAATGETVKLAATGGVPGSVPGSRYGEVPFPAGRDDVREVLVGIPPDTRPGTYDVGLKATIGDEERTGTAKLTVVARTAGSGIVQSASPAGSGLTITVNIVPAPSSPQRERLVLGVSGRTRFGYICSAPAESCSATTAGLYIREDQLGKAVARGTRLRMLRIGGGVMRTTAGRRVVRLLRVSPTARYAVERRGSLNALLVLRAGNAAEAQVRRVTLMTPNLGR